MKTKRIQQTLLLIFTLLSSINPVSFTPTATTSSALDTATGSSMPMSILLESGTNITIFQVTQQSTNKNSLYYTQGTNSSSMTLISDNTVQTKPWVMAAGNADACALYQTFDATNGTSLIINMFTRNQMTFTVDTVASATFSELNPRMARSGSNIAVNWSQGSTIYGRLYTYNKGTAAFNVGGDKLTLVTCSDKCNGVIASVAGTKFAIVYKLTVSPFTIKILFLKADLTPDSTINNGTAISINVTQGTNVLPVYATKRDGSEIAVLTVDDTKLNIFILSTTDGSVINGSSCNFALSGSIVNPSIAETATNGLYAVSFTNSSKGFLIFVDNTCASNLLSNGGTNIQVDSTAGINQDFTSLATSSDYSFFISYIETNTLVTPNTVRVKARVYKMASDCVDVTIYTVPIVTDPLAMAQVTTDNVYISSLPVGGMKSGSSAITLNTSFPRNTIAYDGTKITTDLFTFKLSKYDTPCKASIIKCGSLCATCNGAPTDTNMFCLTCVQNYYGAEGNENCYKKDAIVPQHFFSVDIFKSCYKNCQACTEVGPDETNMKCTLCLDGYATTVDNNSLCFKAFDTPKKYYYDTSIGKFDYCYISCSTCQGKGNDNSHNCLTCADRFAKMGESMNCYDTAIDQIGFRYDTPTSSFIKCYSSCKSCSDVGNDVFHNCVFCLEGYFPSVDAPNNCYSKNTLVPQYYLDTAEAMFKKCYKSCSSCIASGDMNNHKCSGCLDIQGYYPKNGDNSMCYQLADGLDGYYYDQTTTSYLACYKTCKTCSRGGSLLVPYCLTCKPGQNCEPCSGVIYKDTCVKLCPPKTYLDVANRQCIDCTPDNPNCCTTYLYQKQCYTTCPDGTLPDSTGKSCFGCFESGKFAFQDTCVDTCPSGSITINSTCKRCSDSGQVFYNNQCVKQCPSGMIPNNGACDDSFSKSKINSKFRCRVY
jgi:hypothetical protein